MSYVVLLGLILLIGFLNLMTGLVQWLASPIGLVGAFIMINLGLCGFTGFCPPATIARGLCARAGCLSD